MDKSCGTCKWSICGRPSGCLSRRTTRYKDGTDGCQDNDYFAWEPTSKLPVIRPKKEMKFDDGKVDMSLLEYFPNALRELCRVSEVGCLKYRRGSFTEVKNARRRYTAAMQRHFFLEGAGEEPELDADTLEKFGIEIPHDLMTMWNAICRVELRLQGFKLDE